VHLVVPPAVGYPTRPVGNTVSTSQGGSVGCVPSVHGARGGGRRTELVACSVSCPGPFAFPAFFLPFPGPVRCTSVPVCLANCDWVLDPTVVQPTTILVPSVSPRTASTPRQQATSPLCVLLKRRPQLARGAEGRSHPSYLSCPCELVSVADRRVRSRPACRQVSMPVTYNAWHGLTHTYCLGLPMRSAQYVRGLRFS
jgi:hypothetical protein